MRVKLSVFFLALALSVSSAFASSLPVKSLTIETAKSIESDFEYTLNLGKISLDDQIEPSINSFLNSIPNEDELICKVEVTASLDLKLIDVEITVSVEGPCSEVRRSGAEIANQVITEIKNQLTRMGW